MRVLLTRGRRPQALVRILLVGPGFGSGVPGSAPLGHWLGRCARPQRRGGPGGPRGAGPAWARPPRVRGAGSAPLRHSHLVSRGTQARTPLAGRREAVKIFTSE